MSQPPPSKRRAIDDPDCFYSSDSQSSLEETDKPDCELLRIGLLWEVAAWVFL